MTGKGMIAVHVGAGCHSTSLKAQYIKLMKNACREGARILEKNGSALDAVSFAIKIMEDSPLTNAGYGSSLTMDGTVECDASIMDGKSHHHGAVGAVSGVQNPVLLAKEILKAQKHPLPGGLVPPSFLAGSGARDWAVTHDVPVCHPHSLVAEKSKLVHSQSVKVIRQLTENNTKRMRVENNAQDIGIEASLLDTVGAVCVDCEGNVVGAVSSGGLLLKHCGRVGQAAVYGCGCWAQNDFEGSGVNVAVSTSGCGEHLVRTVFGKLCAQSTLVTDPLGGHLADDVTKKFLNSPFLRDVDAPMGGSLSLRHDPHKGVTDLFWLHTTRTMGVAYVRAGLDSKVQASFSELPPDRVGRTVAVNCKSFIAEAPPLGDDVTEEEELQVPEMNATPSIVVTYGDPSTSRTSSIAGSKPFSRD